MSNRIVLRAPGSSNRREPLLQSQMSSRSGTVGEVVGSTTAECVAVCCCFPCSLANLLVLAIYKVPAGLCRRMLKKKRLRKMIKKGLLQPKRSSCSCGCCDDVNNPWLSPMCSSDASDITRLYSTEPDSDAVALEKEMLEKFFSTGFWRSSSRRDYSYSPDTDSSPQSHLSP
ncbi:hypothetical protein VNO77_17911 [Canavalia gladiata]|uniref:Uncharacterized protein n=1 Tax=Canavalia gladiata TaxID=3824 RepID=A0AAN9LN84_CANGL